MLIVDKYKLANWPVCRKTSTRVGRTKHHMLT